MVYDIKEKRVNKVLKTARKYLTWVQNSVLEGELTNASLLKLKTELNNIIDKKEDSILFYLFRTRTYTKREVMGIDKGKEETIL